MSDRLHEPCLRCSEMRNARLIFIGVCQRRSFPELIPGPVKCEHCIDGIALTEEGVRLLSIFAKLIADPPKSPEIPF